MRYAGLVDSVNGDWEIRARTERPNGRDLIFFMVLITYLCIFFINKEKNAKK